MSSLLDEAINAKNNGNRPEAIELLKRLIAVEPNNVDAWLWFARVNENPEIKQECYRCILRFDKNNPVAQTLLQAYTEIYTRAPDLTLEPSPHPKIEIAAYALPSIYDETYRSEDHKIDALHQTQSTPGLKEVSIPNNYQDNYYSPDIDDEKVSCPGCGQIAEPEDLFCINCGKYLSQREGLQKETSQDNKTQPNKVLPIPSQVEPEPVPPHIQQPNPVQNTNPRILPMPGPEVEGPEWVPSRDPGQKPVPPSTQPPTNTSAENQPTHPAKQEKNEEDDLNSRPRHWLVKLGIVVLNIAYLLPWMYASVSSLFVSNSGSFSVLWLAQNEEDMTLPIILGYIVTWAAFFLTRRKRRGLAIFTAILAAICPAVVLSQIAVMAGWSDYGPSRSFLGGGFTGSVYVVPSIGVYAAIAAPLMILLGILFSKNNIKDKPSNEDERETEEGWPSPGKQVSEEENAKEKMDSNRPIDANPPSKGGWGNIKRGLAMGLATGLGATFAAGPLAGIPAAVLAFILFGFIYTEKSGKRQPNR